LSQQELDDFTTKLVTALKTVYDPEIRLISMNSGLSIRWMSPTTRTSRWI
jgi:metal-sulfur cluster biosynthetic enzyme